MKLPIIGILAFVLLYLYAAYLYPGGSQADLATKGFDWMHNYWCDLTSQIARNESPNPAQPYAIAAITILGFTLAYFFYWFPVFVRVEKLWAKIIRWMGVFSMILGTLVFTAWHDYVIIFSGFFGIITLIGVFRGLIINKSWVQLWLGAICGILIFLNNYFYFVTKQLYYLPLLQKIGFAFILLWVISINSKFKVQK